jgi:hypothetical protein
MNAEQKKRRRKELKERATQRRLEKAQKIQEIQELDEEEELDVLETADVSPVVEEEEKKDYYGPEVAGVSQVYPAPTSFAELDEMRTVQEQAQAVQEVTWDTNDLVRNILHSPDLDPVEKAEAMKSVADEFATRVSTEIEEETKDLDLLELEALIAHDRRSTSAFEYFGDFITKAVQSTASRNAMGDSKFAFVTTRDGKKVRKYPIHDKAHVRNALARAAQMIKRGGQAASDARAALSKIHAAAKKMGIGSDMSKERNAILVEKDANNNWRWVGWVSNNFIDWDGDIISEDAHKEYVEWWENNKDVSPAFLSWHTPGTAREQPVDFIMYEKGFLIASGILNEQEAAGLLKAQSKQELGMSHGTFVFGRDAEDPRIITKYRMYEMSDLPLMNAANPFTDFETLVKEVGMEPKDKLAYLTQIMGSEEKAKAFLDKTGMKKEALEAAGIESKEKVETPAPDPKPEPDPVPEPVAAAPVAPTIDEIVAKVMKEMDIPALNTFVIDAKAAMEKVPVLEGVIKDMQGTEEDKLAEKLTPPAARFAWQQENRPSNSKENVAGETEEDKKLKKSIPGVPEDYWLSNATNTAPVAAETK